MHVFSLFLVYLFPVVMEAVGLPPASPLGPGYVPPMDLTSNNSLVPAAWSQFTAIMNSYILTNESVEGLVPDFSKYTMSVSAFSMYDADTAQILQYHHTAADVQKSNIGVNKVDGDSIYRVDSVSKSFTVYLTLIEIGSRYWDCPITDFVADLADYAEKTAADALNVVNWKEVTLGALAGQIAGIPHDDPLLGGELLEILPDPTAVGLPPFNESIEAYDPCAAYQNASGTFCPEDLFLQTVTERAPVYLPWTTPAYTDLGYNLLALAVENITGKSFSAMIKEDMFQPLGLTSTYWSGELPGLTQAVVPGGNTTFGVITIAGTDADAPASGGVYSSVNDLAKYGTSILNSTLLCPEETRKWLKPIAHSGSLELSLGRPWEIIRITQPVSGRVNDLYVKFGSGTGSGALLVLSPDHGAGMSLLVTANTTDDLNYEDTIVGDALTSTVIPALEAQAAKEASQNFAGTYTSTTPGLNSSLTLAVDLTQGPGLIIISWISNSTDMFSDSGLLAGSKGSIYPSNVLPVGTGKAGKIAFRAAFPSVDFSGDVGPFTRQLTIDATWIGMDGTYYRGIGIDLFIFDVDATGKATSVSPAVTRATLKKVE